MVDFLLLDGMNAAAGELDHVLGASAGDPRVGWVVAPDMPGRGLSRPTDLGRVRLRDYVAAAVGALHEADFHGAVVVGYSGGGIYLQAAVAAEPARVGRIVVLCAAIPRRGHSMLAWQPPRASSRLWLWLAPAGRLRPVSLCRCLARGRSHGRGRTTGRLARGLAHGDGGAGAGVDGEPCRSGRQPARLR